MKEIIDIKFKDTIYKINKTKLIYVLSKLEGSKKKDFSDDEIIVALGKYKLKDEVFLENINKI